MNAKHNISLPKIEDDTIKYKYVQVKDYDKLVGKQTNKNEHKLHHSPYCSHGFKHKHLLDNNLHTGCLAVEGQSVELQPDISFKSVQMSVCYV